MKEQTRSTARISPGLISSLSILLYLATLSVSAQNPATTGDQDVPSGGRKLRARKKIRSCGSVPDMVDHWLVTREEGRTIVSHLGDQVENKVVLPPQLKPKEMMSGGKSTLKVLETYDGWLVGFDAGEFGGGLWWYRQDGKFDVQLSSKNVHAIYKTQDGIFILGGLAHMDSVQR